MFYQEKMKDIPPIPANGGTNIQLKNIVYTDNLGLGAMANGFRIAAGGPVVKIPPVTGKDVPKNWWEGDYFARSGDGYSGLDVKNTDDRSLAVRGSCFAVETVGSFVGSLISPKDVQADLQCPPAISGLFRAAYRLLDRQSGDRDDRNSMGGCQSIGKAFWYVPPAGQDSSFQLKFQPVGKFVNNRAHSCYDGVFGETDTGIKSEQLFSKVDGDNTKKNLVAKFDGFTAFRIRNRGIWMRPVWFVFENARVATSREGVSLVTSGGIDGNAPGVWGMLKDSTVIRRVQEQRRPLGAVRQPEPAGRTGLRRLEQGVQHDLRQGLCQSGMELRRLLHLRRPGAHPRRALRELQDRPQAAAHHGRRDDPRRVQPGGSPGDRPSTKATRRWAGSRTTRVPTPWPRETKGLKWDNVDLRTRCSPSCVNFGNFDDGDKNTAIIDRDGTLTGFAVADATARCLTRSPTPAAPPHDQFPISLNNLPFNSASNAVDECNALGAQDKISEQGRPTSLISPANYGTLEFEAFTLPDGRVPLPPGPGDKDTRKLTQFVTFTRDVVDYGTHQSMQLHSQQQPGHLGSPRW